jgi:O-antigen/teichoic acid export membrane protein
MLNKLSLPIKIGLGFGLVGILFVIVGIFRGNVPTNPASIAMALLIGGGFWFLVSWAVATAAVDVETDISEADEQTTVVDA